MPLALSALVSTSLNLVATSQIDRSCQELCRYHLRTPVEPEFQGAGIYLTICAQVEALAQLAGLVCLQMEGAEPGAVFFFAAVDGVKWKKPVVPGDVLVMEVEITKWASKFGVAKASGKGYVDGKLAVQVKEMTFALAK